MMSKFAKIIKVLSGSLLALTLISFLGSFNYYADVFDSFRFQYLLISLIFAIFFILKKDKKWFWITIVVSLINSAVIWSSLKSSSQKTKQSVRVLYSNVLTSNSSHQKLIELIREHQPDLVMLVEINSDWVSSLQKIEKEYPFKLVHSREDNFGIGVYSKKSFSQSLLVETINGPESIHVELKINSVPLAFFLIHPLPPSSQKYWEKRNRLFSSFAQYINNVGKDLAVIGDLNTVGWGAFMRKFKRESGLELFDDVYDTWPTFFPPFMRVNLDHVLAGRDAYVKRVRLPSIDSDHFPLLIDYHP